MKKFNTKQLFFVVSLGILLNTGVVMAKSDKSKGKPEQSLQPAKEWYMKTSVSVIDQYNGNTWIDNFSGVFGKLKASSDGYDRHDIPAFRSTANSPAALVFVHDDWGPNAGEYLSDYHGNNRQSDSWLFSVNSSIEDGLVTLTWDGLFELTQYEKNTQTRYSEKKTRDSRTLEDLHLIDLETLEVIEAVSDEGKLNHYTFYMGDETSRQFRWILGPVNASYFEPASGAMHYIKMKQRELKYQQRQAEYDFPIDDLFGSPPQ